MKKRGLILIPVLIASLAGCKQSSGSNISAEMRKAHNLTFNKNYARRLGNEVDIDIYNYACEAFYNNAMTAKRVQAIYDEESYQYDQIVITSSEHSVYTLYQDYATQYARTKNYEEYFTADKKRSTINSTYESEEYYDDSRKVYFSHEVKNGSHNLYPIGLGDYDEEHINNYISTKLDDAYDFTLINTSYCNFYEKKNGYIGYYESQAEYEDDGHRYGSSVQVIYEFDSAFRTKKGSYFVEYYENYDYTRGVLTNKMRCVRYTHELYEFTFGNKKPETVVSGNIQKLYGKPYIDYGYMYFGNCESLDDYGYMAKKTSPTNLHLEGFLFFDSFSGSALDVTPDVYAVTNPSLYDDDYTDTEIVGKLSIKNSKLLKYLNGHLMYSMKYATEALWYKIDCVLDKNNVPKFKSGSIEVVDRVTLETYYYSLDW